MAGHGGSELANLLEGLIELTEQAGDPDEQFLARFGYLHPAAVPAEEGKSDVLLQQPDLTGQRGLRHAKPVRGFPRDPVSARMAKVRSCLISMPGAPPIVFCTRCRSEGCQPAIGTGGPIANSCGNDPDLVMDRHASRYDRPVFQRHPHHGANSAATHKICDGSHRLISLRDASGPCEGSRSCSRIHANRREGP